MQQFATASIIILSLFLLVGCGGSSSTPVSDNTSSVTEQLPVPAPLRPLDMSTFNGAIDLLDEETIAVLDTTVMEATIEDLQVAMNSGDLDSVTLVTYYLYRIQQYDVGGLQSVIELNPDVLTEAQASDDARANGDELGALHGIPVLLKDNISTVGPMHTTAGAAALMDNVADRDAFLVTQLRDAGAVILGKGNLSEFANWVDPNLPDGYSAVGGQVVSPYDPAINPLGSSTGPAVAVSANLTAVGIGTETQGSLLSPASVNGIVAMYPSRGLVSRDRIIPLAESQDTAGPMTRTVTDAAIVLNIISSVDGNDPVTQEASAIADTDFTALLGNESLDGMRIGLAGFAEELVNDEEFIASLGLDVIIETLEGLGAEVVAAPYGDSDLPLDVDPTFAAGFNLGLASYLADANPSGDIQSVGDVVAFNETNLEQYAPYGQSSLQASADSSMSIDDYNALGDERRVMARQALDSALDGVDAIVTFSSSVSRYYTAAGYPAIIVPFSTGENGAPRGLFIVGTYLNDAELLGIAYTIEQATQARVVPPVE